MKLSVPIFFVLLQVIKTVLSINSLPNRSVRDGIKSITSNNIQTFTPIVNSPIKLPVWPVWGGVMAQVADWIKLHSISDAIISTIGGRVVPMTLAEYDVSPFLLLAHHVHSFTPFDPIRSITKFVLPEGFPAHPHAGFDTVTYCIDGGLCHRDSEGLKMSYGDGEVQWMRAGRGTIHEEMWDLKSSSMSHKRIEIFQLWVNLKEKNKNDAPSVHLLKNNDIPVVTVGDDVATIKVISGCLNIIGNSDDDSIEAIHRLSKEDYHITSINGVTPSKKLSLCQSTIDQQVIGPGSAVAASPVSILHITIKPNEEIALATSVKSTVFAYVRKGSLLTSRSSTDGETDSDVEEVRKNKNIVFRPLGLSESSTDAAVVLKAGKKGFDGIILMGEPINERVIWRGPLVQSTEEKLLEKSMIFDRIGMKAYWNNGDSDEKWTEHCQQLQLQKTIKTLLNKK